MVSSSFRIGLVVLGSTFGLLGACASIDTDSEKTDVWLPGGDVTGSSGEVRPSGSSGGILIGASGSVGAGGMGGFAGAGGMGGSGGAGGAGGAGGMGGSGGGEPDAGDVDADVDGG